MLNNKNILIVEDDNMSRVIYRMVVEKAGAHLTFVSHAQQVLAQLQSKSWDMVILNLDLSYDNNGFALFQQIRDMPDYQILPIVGVSCHDVSIIMPQAQKLGFDGFIAKPINQHFFHHQLTQILAGQPVWNTLDYAL